MFTSLGHFDPLNPGHVSFYKSDYLDARADAGEPPLLLHETSLPSPAPAPAASPDSLCDLFRRHAPALHALAAPEPSLRLRYREILCPAPAPASCLARRRLSLGRRPQLGNLVLDSNLVI